MWILSIIFGVMFCYNLCGLGYSIIWGILFWGVSFIKIKR